MNQSHQAHSQQQPHIPKLLQVNIHELAEKCQSKKEVYTFLSQDCGAYLPKMDTVNVYFLKQILRGEKDYIKRSAVKVAYVPQIEGLTTEDFLKFCKGRPDLLKLIPNERDWQHLDKKWVCDVLYTKDPDAMTKMITEAMKKRKERLEKNQDLLVDMRPEFAEALKNTIQFSTEKGKSAFLLKGSAAVKRKRSDIEEVKNEEQMLEQDKQQFLKQFKKLRLDNQGFSEEMAKLKQIETQMNNLQRQGYLDQHGNPVQRKQ